jgi:uncharacterized protein YjdB
MPSRRIAAAVLTAAVLAGCSGGGTKRPEVTLDAITVLPADPTIARGGTKQFSATGIYADGSSVPLTTGVVWASSDTAVATIGSSGLATGGAVATTGTTTISATFEGKTGQTTLTVSNPLQSIAIDDATMPIPSSFDLQLTVTGTYGSSVTAAVPSSAVTWSSANEAVATVGANTGLVHGVAAGQVVVTASYQGKTDTFTVTVSDAALASISVAPADAHVTSGLAGVQLDVTARYDDGGAGFTVPVPRSAVAWVVKSGATAAISATGFVTSVLPAPGAGPVEGPTTFTATFGLRSADVTVTVDPAIVASVRVYSDAVTAPYSLPNGRTLALHAEATLTDGRKVVLTGTGWETSAAGVATVVRDAGDNTVGVVTARADSGSATIGYRDGGTGVTGSVTVTATPAVIEPATLRVAPADPALAKGQSLQFAAWAVLSSGPAEVDVTSRVAWSTPDGGAVVSISASGLAHADATGAERIRATDPASGELAETSLSVGPPVLDHLTISPDAQTAPAGIARTFSVTAVYSDGGEVPDPAGVVWDGGGATVVASGVEPGPPSFAYADVRSAAEGTFTVTAGYGGKQDAATFTAGAPIVESVTVSPGTATIDEGGTGRFTAAVLLSNGAAGTASFTSGDPAVLTIDPVTGEATGVAAGSAVVTASAGGKSGTAAVTVVFPEFGVPLDGRFVFPADAPFAIPSAAAGATRRFEVSGFTPGDAYALDFTGLEPHGDVTVTAYADRALTAVLGEGRALSDGAGVTATPVRFVADADGVIYLEASWYAPTAFALDASVYGGPMLLGDLFYDGTGGEDAFPFTGSSGGGDLHYRIFGLIPGIAYTVTLSGAPAEFGLAVYRDPTFLQATCGVNPAAVECGFVAGAGGDAWVKVITGTGAGSFQLDVAPRSAVAVADTLLFPDAFAFGATVTGGDVSWYRVIGLSPGVPYLLSVAGGQELWVYEDALATSLACWTDAAHGTQVCSAYAPASGDLYVAVDGRVVGGDFTLGATSLASAGALAYGSGFPQQGTLAPLSAVVHEVTGLTPGARYVYVLDGVTDVAQAAIYGDAALAQSLCQAVAGPTGGALCSFRATSSSAWLQVFGGYAPLGTGYRIDVAPLEGSSTLAGTALPQAGTVGTGVRGYVVDGLAPGASYTASLGALTGDADLYLYEGGSTYVAHCVSAAPGTATETCVAHAGVDGRLYVTVYGGHSASGADFSLGVAATAAQSRTGLFTSSETVTRLGGLYRVGALTPGLAYTFEALAPSADVTLRAYDLSWNLLCQSENPGPADKFCSIPQAPASGAVYVEIDALATASGATFTLSASL